MVSYRGWARVLVYFLGWEVPVRVLMSVPVPIPLQAKVHFPTRALEE